MVGDVNTCAISIRNFVKDFSLSGARSKSIIVIPDIRAPKNGIPPEVVEIIKAIIGNDPIDVNGKGRDIVTEPLPGKIFAASNDMIDFIDPSGAFFERLITLKFTRSFLPPDHPDYVAGQDQDPDLKDKLTAELPGILNWAIQGLYRVKKNKRFIQSATSLALKNELAQEGTPIKKFISDCLVLSGSVLVDTVYERYQSWCTEHDYECDTKRDFGKLLKAACPTIKNEKSVKLDNNGIRAQ